MSVVHDIFSGQMHDADVDIYVGAAQASLPADIDTSADGSLTFTGFTKLSFKETPVKVTYAPEFTEEYVRESAGPIWSFLEKESLKIGFGLKDARLAQLKRAVAAAALSTQAAGASQVGQDILQIGDGPVSAVSLLLHFLNKDDYYRLYYMGICIPTGQVEVDHDRAKALVVPYEFTVHADISKAKGSRLIEIYDMTALATS